MATTAEKIEATTGLLAQGVAEVIESGDFKRALTMAGRVHTYSISNTMLIMAQKPSASRVAGFKSWLGMNRCVRKGEKGIQIYVPHIHKLNEGEEDRPRVSFGVGYVFDVEQTDGEDLPEVPSVDWLDGEALDGFLDAAIGFATAQGIRAVLSSCEVPDASRGFWRATAREIHLSVECGGLQRAKTFIHELAHALDTNLDADRGRAEAVAEGVAYTVTQYFGMETGDQSLGYIAAWCTDKDRFMQVMGEIQKISHTIIEGVGEQSLPDQIAA
ncbi:MAG: ArdC family protein [Gemmatimonadaceae bacterium]